MPDILDPAGVVLDGQARTLESAIEEAGRLLVGVGAVDESYVAAMHERETSVSTYMGNGLAIPHGTNEAKPAIRRTAISFVRYSEPIDWKGQPAEFVVGIAGAGDDHLTVLSQLAGVFTDDDQIGRLRAADSVDVVLGLLDPGAEG
jgi:PTS system mannitol-specific IIC component